MSRYFLADGDRGGGGAGICFLCGGPHARRDCPNRVCMSCGEVGHARCKKRPRFETCWDCLGRHVAGQPCIADVLSLDRVTAATYGDAAESTEAAAAAKKKPKTKKTAAADFPALCTDCGAANHLACAALPGTATPEGLQHCTLCGVDGHTAYGCRRPGFIISLIRAQKAANDAGQNATFQDPRYPARSAPAFLATAGPPAHAEPQAGGGGGAGKGEKREKKKKEKKDKKDKKEAGPSPTEEADSKAQKKKGGSVRASVVVEEAKRASVVMTGEAAAAAAESGGGGLHALPAHASQYAEEEIQAVVAAGEKKGPSRSPAAMARREAKQKKAKAKKRKAAQQAAGGAPSAKKARTE